MFKKTNKQLKGHMATMTTAPTIQTQAPTPAPVMSPTTTVSRTELITTMVPGCCGLKIIHLLACLGKVDALSAQKTEAFDKQVNVGTANEGNWSTYGKAPETIAIISTSSRYHYNDPEQKEFKRQQEFLTSKGWQELCSWKSLESGGTNYMWGSKGISLAGKEEAKK